MAMDAMAMTALFPALPVFANTVLLAAVFPVTTLLVFAAVTDAVVGSPVRVIVKVLVVGTVAIV